MSKSFNQIVAKEFAAAMSSKFPEFAPTKADRLYGWPGEKAFSCSRAGRHDWLSLYFSKNGVDEFTVDVGWSYLCRYPQLPSRPLSGSGLQLAKARASEAFVRVRPLSGSLDDWWVMGSGFAVDRLVSDAMDCIERHAIPLLALLPETRCE